ncbi:hypothetical protein VOLCADRAFT_100505, partial [Volvox carteri f. nagariensis]
MTFSAVVEGTEVHRSLVGMLGSGAKEESLKRYIREGLALQTSEYKEQVRDMSHDAALSFILEQVRRTTPAEGQIGCVDNMTYHWPMRPWTRLYEAASAADRTMTTEGGDSATAQLPLPAPEDARGGEAAALPSPSAAGPAAMPGPRHTAGHQEGGDSATAQLPPPAPEDARGGEAAALPSPSAAGPAAMPGPRHTAGHQVGVLGCTCLLRLAPWTAACLADDTRHAI